MAFAILNQHNQSRFTAQPEETLLAAALRHRRLLPYGCRDGRCGACKCDLVEGDIAPYQAPTPALAAGEAEAGKILLCQARAMSDLVIDIEELATSAPLRVENLPCQVKSVNQVARDVMIVHLALPPNRDFDYLPGQYIDILLRDGQRRSFSIANRPEDSRESGIELHIRRVPGGRFSARAFDSIRPKEILRISGPYGSYILRSAPPTPLLMVAGGTGVAPIKALLAHVFTQPTEQPIELFWGARDPQDLYLADWLEALGREHPNLRYTPVLSEDCPDWSGARGFVHEQVASRYTDLSAHDVYASGPPVMLEALAPVLAERRHPTERFFFDSFEYAAVAPAVAAE